VDWKTICIVGMLIFHAIYKDVYIYIGNVEGAAIWRINFIKNRINENINQKFYKKNNGGWW
jgi:hypothetical protein